MPAGPVQKGDVLELIGQIDRLPTPPVVFSQINRVLTNPQASAYDVAKIIAEDPATSARVLRMANSAYYGLSQPVVSVRQAVVILGMEAIRSLVLSSSVMEAFKGAAPDDEYQENFWRHSLATASAARVLHGFKLSDQVMRGGEEGFSAGLLHDIGKMVLVWQLPELYARVTSHPDFGVVDDQHVEREVMGVTHGEIGGYLAGRWNLPESLCLAITHHHDLDASTGGNCRLAKVVHVADYLAHWTLDPRPESQKVLPIMDWDVAAEFGVHEDSLTDVGSLVMAEFGRSEIFLEMLRR
ncbi:MAG: hypothetical protein Kow0074_07640 [Candidatus Zixiibacteriota bacterium]